MKIARLLVQLFTSAVVITSFYAVPAFGADAMNEQVFMNAGDLKWGDAPPALPKGAKITALSGDPNKPGPYVVRVKMPAGYKVPPHWHSQAENLTILSGALYLGSGDKMEPADAHGMKAGGFHYLPAKVHHYAFTKSPTVVQIHGEGPFDINYINPDDDPRKAAKQ